MIDDFSLGYLFKRRKDNFGKLAFQANYIFPTLSLFHKCTARPEAQNHFFLLLFPSDFERSIKLLSVTSQKLILIKF